MGDLNATISKIQDVTEFDNMGKWVGIDNIVNNHG